MTTENSNRAKMDYYGLGKVPKYDLTSTQRNLNKNTSNISNSMLERNALSLNSTNLEKVRNNYRQLHGVNETKKEANNYIDPIPIFEAKNLHGVKPELSTRASYNLTKEKYFALDINPSLNNGMRVSKRDFSKIKQSSFPGITTASNSKQIEDNSHYFDRNSVKILRYPKGFWDIQKKNADRTKISDEAPQWFHLVTEEKKKKWDEAFIKKGETLRVVSRFQDWITVTPRSKNRHKPLEKIKLKNIAETSKIMPDWMQNTSKNKEVLLTNNMVSALYYEDAVNSKNEEIRKKFTVLVDKNINDKKYKDQRSVFSIGDYRHNLIYKNDSEFFASQVSQQPKNFLSWDDGAKFNPKYKKDKFLKE